MLELHGRRLDLVTLDYETAWGKDYTLSKMPTSKYVMDDRFHAYMCGIKFNDQQVKVWDSRDIKYALKQFDWKRTALLAYNTPFDGFICTQRFGITPAYYLDALSIARGALGHGIQDFRLDTIGKLLGVGGKVGGDVLTEVKDKYELTDDQRRRMADYCAIDVQRCHDVFHKLYHFIPDDELDLIDITLRLFCEPVLGINEALVQEELDEEISGKVRSIMFAGCSKEDLMSNVKFPAKLVAAGANLIYKVSPRTGKSAPALSSTDLEPLYQSGNERVRQLIDARRKVKSTIGATRAQAFLDTAADLGRMPVMLNYYGAHTGRWSGGNKMNMQNLPRDGRLRKSLTAPKGHMIVVADSAQIEARVNAWLWGQQDLVEAFRLKRDIYSEFATALYGYPVDRKYYEMRDGEKFYPQFKEGFVGKMAILGLGFQMGAAKFYDAVTRFKVSITMEQAADAVALYRQQNNMIARGWKTLQNLIPKMTLQTFEYEHGPLTFLHEAIRLPNGMFLRYPNLQVQPGMYEHSFGEATFAGRRGARNKLYGGLMGENIVQALARIIVADQMLTMHREGLRVVLMTHDEVAGIVPTRKAEKMFERMIQIMSTPPEWAQGLPLFAEGGFAENYSK